MNIEENKEEEEINESPSCVAATYKTNEGHLYPLDYCFLFVTKPVFLFKNSDIRWVEFGRYYHGGQISIRSFELKFCVKGFIHEFVNIERSE